MCPRPVCMYIEFEIEIDRGGCGGMEVGGGTGGWHGSGKSKMVATTHDAHILALRYQVSSKLQNKQLITRFHKNPSRAYPAPLPQPLLSFFRRTLIVPRIINSTRCAGSLHRGGGGRERACSHSIIADFRDEELKHEPGHKISARFASEKLSENHQL